VATIDKDFRVKHGLVVEANTHLNGNLQLDGAINGLNVNAQAVYTQAAFDTANSAGIYANTAINNSNLALNNSYSAQIYANNGILLAQAAYDQSNSIAPIANTGATLAQASYNQGNSTAIVANTAVNNAASASLYANTGLDLAQASYNQGNSITTIANTANNTAASASIAANNKVDKSGDTITGDLIVTGNANVYTRLAVGTGAYQVLPNLIAQFTGTSDEYIQINSQNLNGNGSADFVTTANNGTDLSYFTDLGKAGSTYTNSYPDEVIGNNDSYLIAQGLDSTIPGSNLIIAATTATYGDIIFAQGGLDTGKEVARFAMDQGFVIQKTTVSTSNATGALVVKGGVGIQGDVYADNIISGNINLKNYTQSSFDKANTATNNAASASLYANSGITLAQAAFDSANNVSPQVQPAFDKANTATNNAASASLYANSGITLAQAAFDQGNSTATVANTAINNAASASLYANSGITLAQAAYNEANLKFNSTGGTISGNVTISGNNDLIVTGNLIINGNISSQNVQSLEVADPLILLGVGNYVSDTRDIGFASHYNGGTNAHAGLIRDADVNKEWYFFEGYTGVLDANNNIDITDPTFKTANVHADIFYGNVIGTTINSSTVYVGGDNLGVRANNAYDQANAANSLAQAAFNQANTAGLDQYARDTANSAGIYANTGITLAQAAFDKANTGGGSNGSNGIFATLDTFTANGLTNSYTLSFAPANEEVTTINFDGIIQQKSQYSLSGNTVIFTETPNTGTIIEISAWSNSGNADYILTNIDYQARSFANIAADLAQSSFNKANSATDLAQSAFNKANSAVISLTANSNTRITQSATTGAITFDLAASGVVAGSYSYPSLQVDAYGRITTISTQTPVTSVAGVSDGVSNTQLLAGILTVDGPGSGLDADLLDGLSGTYYTDLTNTSITLAQASYDAQNSTAIIANAAVSATSTTTLTNKRITPRIASNGATTSGNITPPGDTCDQFNITGLTGTANIQIPSGTPTDGQKLNIRIKDNGTGRSLTWVTAGSGAYRVIGVTLPTTTVANKTIYVGCVYNLADDDWDVVAVASEV
jgi:hypothetical protein